MHCRIETDGDLAVIHVDQPQLSSLQVSQELREELAAFLEQGPPPHVALEMSAVEYINSSALGKLVWFSTQIEEQGGVCAVVGLQHDLRRLFEKLMLDSVFSLFDDVDAFKAGRAATT